MAMMATAMGSKVTKGISGLRCIRPSILSCSSRSNNGTYIYISIHLVAGRNPKFQIRYWSGVLELLNKKSKYHSRLWQCAIRQYQGARCKTPSSIAVHSGTKRWSR